MKETKQTPLYDTHVHLKAKMTNFGGFDMPVWYTSIKDEHMAVRNSAGVFDISHMGVLKVAGESAFDSLQHLTCNDVNKSKNGHMIYSMMLTEKGTILDDLMVGELSEKTYIVVVNASNAGKILAWMTPKLESGTYIEDLTKTHGLLAVQGPKAVELLSKITQKPLGDHPRFSLFKETWKGVDCLFMRTGYTGEDGFEISIPNAALLDLWTDLLDNGITPCGLGARDTLRLEAGLPLYGQELSEEITPLMTRYSWVVKFTKDFIGRAALENSKLSEQPYTTVGIQMQERVIPRTGYAIKEGGQITSGTLSPVLDMPIAMALIPPQHATIGSVISVEIRGKYHAATIVPIPFIPLKRS